MTTTIKDHGGRAWVRAPRSVAEDLDLEEVWTCEECPRAQIDRLRYRDDVRWVVVVDGDEWTHCDGRVPLADAVELLPTHVLGGGAP